VEASARDPREEGAFEVRVELVVVVRAGIASVKPDTDLVLVLGWLKKNPNIVDGLVWVYGLPMSSMFKGIFAFGITFH
jgi:hypothetical protein